MSAIFEQDINGDYQPTGLAGAVAVNFELDPNGDIMPRTAPRIAVMPLGLAASDPATDGDLLISISNAAAYLLGERIDVYDNATNLLLGSFDAAVGSGKISGLTNATAYTVYATAGGDTFEDSTASVTASATPTKVTATADYPAVGDVESGVIFDSGNKTGTFAVPAVSDVRTAIGFGANGVEFIGSLVVGGGTTPGAPTLDSLATGNAQITVTLTAANAADVVYARYRTSHDGAWAPESEIFKRTGSGSIVITGLTNSIPYEIICYAKNGTAISDLTVAMIATPTDGSAAIFVSILNAVVAELNAQNWLDLTGAAIVATKDYLPTIDPENAGPLDTPKIFVMPGEDAPQPDAATVDLVRYPVEIVLVQRVAKDATYTRAQKIERMILLKRQVQTILLNKRLAAFSRAYGETIAPTAAYDYTALKEDEQFRTGVSVTYVTTEAT